MDLAIITTKSQKQKEFWEKRLRLTFPHLRFIVEIEDWPGGAGNGLGTLYAFRKANAAASQLFQASLVQGLEKGQSLALYHCAGEGQRLYPLSASEHNNKAALKLPGLITCGPNEESITLLEAILKQTTPLVKQNRGRLSVFWADQLFFPSQTPSSPQFPLEIYSREEDFPSAQEWNARRLENYGVICSDKHGEAHLLEKGSYSLLQTLIQSGFVDPSQGLQISFGSFSLALELLQDLLQVFDEELRSKKGKMDTDPHFWMPLTLPSEVYQKLMNKKMPSEVSASHYQRLQSLKTKYQPLFGAVNLGKPCGWWDFGNVKAYMGNLLKMLDSTEDSQRVRDFLKMPQTGILNSAIRQGKITHSIVVGTTAEELNAENSVIIGSEINKLTCRHSLFYNVHEAGILENQEGVVRADIQNHKFYSTADADPKEHWKEKIGSNPMSWEQLHQFLSD